MKKTILFYYNTYESKSFDRSSGCRSPSGNLRTFTDKEIQLCVPVPLGLRLSLGV